MTFEQFVAVVQDWQNRLTPEQARMATGSIPAYGIVDFPRGTTVDEAFAMVARGEPAPVRDEAVDEAIFVRANVGPKRLFGID